MFVKTFLETFQNIWRIIYTIASILCKNMLVYLSLDIICLLKLTFFLELLEEEIMSVDKYPCIFLHQMEDIVPELVDFVLTR